MSMLGDSTSQPLRSREKHTWSLSVASTSTVGPAPETTAG